MQPSSFSFRSILFKNWNVWGKNLSVTATNPYKSSRGCLHAANKGLFLSGFINRKPSLYFQPVLCMRITTLHNHHTFPYSKLAHTKRKEISIKPSTLLAFSLQLSYCSSRWALIAVKYHFLFFKKTQTAYWLYNCCVNRSTYLHHPTQQKIRRKGIAAMYFAQQKKRLIIYNKYTSTWMRERHYLNYLPWLSGKALGAACTKITKPGF